MYAVKVARIARERALKLSSGKTASWNNIMKNGKFINLPTHDPQKEVASHIAPVDKTPPNERQQKKSAYKQLLEMVKSVETQATAIRKKKKRKTNGNGIEFLQGMPLTSMAV